MNKSRVVVRAVLAMIAVCFSGAAPAVEMPRLQFAIGDVYAIGTDDIQRRVKKGDKLLPSERLVTGKGAMAQLRIFDQGVVVLKGNGLLELQKPIDDKFAVMLDKGLMRTVTRLGYKLGRIDVIAPGVDLDVEAGDVLTGVGLFGQEDTATLYRVLDGDIKVKTGKQEKIAQVGKVVKVDAFRGQEDALEVTPDAMRLKVPEPKSISGTLPGGSTASVSSRSAAAFKGSTAASLGKSFDSDMSKIAVLNPGAVDGLTRTAVNVPVAVNKLNPDIKTGLSDLHPTVKVNYDGVKVYDPRISFGTDDEKLSVNSALIVSFPSSISRVTNFVPVTPTDPAISKSLVSSAQIINLQPTLSVAGETTLSSSVLPEIKVITYDSTVVNPILAETIKTSTAIQPTRTTTAITSTICKTCINSLTLIKP